MQRTTQFNVRMLTDDMAGKGWHPADLASHAGVSRSTVTRFMRGEYQTPRMAKKLAVALGYSVRRYLVRHPVTA